MLSISEAGQPLSFPRQYPISMCPEYVDRETDSANAWRPLVWTVHHLRSRSVAGTLPWHSVGFCYRRWKQMKRQNFFSCSAGAESIQPLLGLRWANRCSPSSWGLDESRPRQSLLHPWWHGLSDLATPLANSPGGISADSWVLSGYFMTYSLIRDLRVLQES